MPVAFNNMPAVIRTGLFFAEINAGSPPYSGISTQILIGHKLTGGSAPVGVLQPLGGQDPNALFGAGSILADMAQYARWHDPVGAIYVLPVAEPGGGGADTRTLTFTAATVAGTLVRYIAGEKVSIPVAAGDTAAAIATRFAAAVNAGYVRFNKRMLWTVTAAAVAAVVTLTSRHAGTVGKQVRVEAGLEGNEVDPAGVTVTVATGTAGTGDVDVAAALAFLNTIPATWITSAFEATTTILNATSLYLSDAGGGGWSPMVQKRGHFTSVLGGNLAALTAFGAARNDPHATIFGVQNFPHPLWCIAAALNGVIARSKNIGAALTEAIEISRPLQTLPLQGIRAPKVDLDRFNRADRETLLQNGISTFTVDHAGVVRLERIITTYLTNAAGALDTTFLDIETLAQSMYIASYLRQRVETTYPRHVLLDRNPGTLQGVVTPDGARATVVHVYNELYQAGIVEKPELIAKYLIVERSNDGNRLNCFLPVDVANQLRVFAANVTLYTEFDPNRQAA